MKIYSILLLLIIASCSSYTRTNDAFYVSNKGQLQERTIQSDIFLLTSYERVTSKNNVVNVYVEGDGLAWLSKSRPSLDPTPKNPVSLKLASLDTTNNVIYLARPCQYTKMIDGSACDKKYWTSHRFAPEVIDTISSALDNIKKRHQITGFNLIGFSGGGNVAALLVAQRNDVLSLRTVAGNLDHKLQSSIHGVSAMPYSLNAVDIANQISNIPQIHFVGSEDKIVPNEIAQSYNAHANSNKCVQIQLVQGVKHTKGWESVWKSLLSQPFNCEVG